MDEMADRFPYWMSAALLIIGLYGMIGKRNLAKKLIGMSIFQSAIILFFISGSLKRDATVPIIQHDLGPIDPNLYVNPLPHALMLTAIVVSVAIFGIALAFVIRIYREYRTLDEEELLRQVQE